MNRKSRASLKKHQKPYRLPEENKKQTSAFRERIVGNRIKTEGNEPDLRASIELANSTIETSAGNYQSLKKLDLPIHSRFPRLNNVKHSTALPIDNKNAPADDYQHQRKKSLEVNQVSEVVSRQLNRSNQPRQRKYNLLNILQERKVASYITGGYKTDIYDQYIQPDEPENIPVVLSRAFFPLNMPRRYRGLVSLPTISRRVSTHMN